MGIINMTPDSFSNDGLYGRRNYIDRALRKALSQVKEGADIIDIGGESTRPGSKPISEKEEIQRIIPLIERLAKKINIPISADTYKPEVAKRALDAGATIINNIMGVKNNRSLLKMVKNYNAAIVLMHIHGTPRTMQKSIYYKDLLKDIINSLRNSIEKCLEIGINSDRIIIDPGIGFGKTFDHNLTLINNLEKFNILKKPILTGTSRKSFIGKILNKPAEDRLFGSIASMCACLMKGAHIVRVNDVKESKDAATIVDSILNESPHVMIL